MSQTAETPDVIEMLFAERRVIDVHVNVGHRSADDAVYDGEPQGEHVRRQFAAADLERTDLGNIGLRTHYSRVELPATASPRFIPSVALNWTGIEPQRVEQELQCFDHPHPLIWFQSFRDPYHRSVIDAAYRRSIAAGGSEVGSISHTDEHGRLTDASLAVLEVAQARGAVITTPHANWERTLPLIIQALDMGLHVLWVHPDSRLIRVPLAVQQWVMDYARRSRGAVFIERAAVFLRDGKPGAYSAEQTVAEVRAIGREHIIFSSDLGRYKEGDPLLPDAGLRWYIGRLHAAGLTADEASRGLIQNPHQLFYGGLQ